jgi:hypothetical protein
LVIEKELITKIITLEPGSSYTEAAKYFAETRWSPNELVNYDDYYIAPGLIDLNV